MRILNNFNYNQSFKGINISDKAASMVGDLLEEEPDFKKSFEKLETLSNDNDIDVFIQKTKNDDGLNFQAVDPYTHETLCYLSGDNNPKRAAKNALDTLLEFIENSKQTYSTKINSPINKSGASTEDSAAAKIFKFLASFI